MQAAKEGAAPACAPKWPSLQCTKALKADAPQIIQPAQERAGVPLVDGLAAIVLTLGALGLRASLLVFF